MISRLRLAVLAALAVSATATACGPQPAPLPTIHFVGNSTCPTDGQTPYDPSPPNTNDNGNPVGQAIDEMPHTHVTSPAQVQYNHDPPTSGCHYNQAGSATQLSAPLTHGTYNQVIAPEYWVHDLEHGYVVVLYNCPNNSCPSDFNTLLKWEQGLQPETNFAYAKVVVVGESTMKEKFAVVSWDWYLGLGNTLDINKIQSFYDNHKGQAPEGAGTA